MTREEAKREMQFAKREVVEGSWIDKAYAMAIEALSDVPDTNVGKWIYSYSDRTCSVCNASFDDEIVYMCKNGQLNFCPNCGSKMMESDD